jgi:DNA ligase D-like protein (predicted 3'-phosphoesterase)
MPAKKKDIQEYNRKRHFEATPEPEGKVAAKRAKQLEFVIQKHDASSLHYDWRLEVDGVMPSWAVPKGPSMFPSVRRLAMHVEDHPMSYRTFEGVIPEGNYGAGNVIVWDRGTYRNLLEEKTGKGKKTMRQAIADGKVEVWLEGEKLKGGFVLIRTNDEKDQWILKKMQDDEAWEQGPDVTEKYPKSVKSGKTVEEVTEADGKHGAKKSQSAEGAGA